MSRRLAHTDHVTNPVPFAAFSEALESIWTLLASWMNTVIAGAIGR